MSFSKNELRLIEVSLYVFSQQENMHESKITKINKKEMKICREIGRDLKKNNIFFSGIDFISGKLNGDINVTSPTGIKTYFDLSQINLAKTFWKGL